MRTEAPTRDIIDISFSLPCLSDLTPLELDTRSTTNLISGITEQWLLEGDQMFTSGTSKVEAYINVRDRAIHTPRYTNAVDVRDKNAIPNRESGGLDTAFAKLHALWRIDPEIKFLLDKEREKFDVRYRDWYGTVDEPGERNRFLQQLFSEKQQMGHELSEREIEAREMKARRSYFLPTITTASEFPV